MGVTANEQESRHSTQIDANRRNGNVFSVAPDAQHVKRGKFTIAYGNWKNGECVVYNRLNNIFSEDFAKRLRALIAEDWDFAVIE